MIFLRRHKIGFLKILTRITLVLDEAHSYTGAKGLKLHLARRLKERLGL